MKFYFPGKLGTYYYLCFRYIFYNLYFLGGENIRDIMRVSGAHVELERNQPPGQNDKVFNIKGNQSQIQHAISLIQEKTGQQGNHNDQVRPC